jgi:hypothetical protein
VSERTTILFRREPHPYDGAREVARARAHKLLDAARAQTVRATQAEITAALWATGDMVPVVTHSSHEGAAMT